jgi:hypothetical protein
LLLWLRSELRALISGALPRGPAILGPEAPGVGQGPSATRPTIWIAITFTMVAEGKIMA